MLLFLLFRRMPVVISWLPNSKATFTAAVFVMDEENGVLLQTVRLLQRKLDKYSGLNDEKKVMFYLGRLRKSDMTVDILRDTGVGRTVNFVRINKSGPMAEESPTACPLFGI
ncbi:unnamed protein product [Cyprideis torosa]|uniref:Uncharacterized protein n=1 Tax=Cyprideis torosa TaxID=163714 RepID=A0A7R8ZRU4_9CRUS|nr:unnamed protein product [Cyprideis torosa]CAG0904564.1 unnamed protein product [Cyprideis torosa]